MLKDDYNVADGKEILGAKGAVVGRRRRGGAGAFCAVGERVDLGTVEARKNTYLWDPLRRARAH